MGQCLAILLQKNITQITYLDNGIDSRTISKLLYRHQKKPNVISALETQKQNKIITRYYLHIREMSHTCRLNSATE